MAVATRKKLTVQPKEGMTLDGAFEQFVQSKAVMNTAEETIKHFKAFSTFQQTLGGDESMTFCASGIICT
jgi:hypothetical protein